MQYPSISSTYLKHFILKDDLNGYYYPDETMSGYN